MYALSSSAVVLCIFFLPDVLRVFKVLFPSFSPHFTALVCLPVTDLSEKEIHKITSFPIFFSWILPETASCSLTFGKQCYNPIILRFFFFYIHYLQKSETCFEIMLPWCCLRLGLASSQRGVWVALFLEFKDAPLTFFLPHGHFKWVEKNNQSIKQISLSRGQSNICLVYIVPG